MKKEDLKKTRQYKRLCENPRAVVHNVPLTWCTRFDISPAELLIFCHIDFHTHHTVWRSFRGSIKGLAVLCNISIPTTRRMVERLEEKGFIRKSRERTTSTNGNEVLWVSYESMLPQGCAPNDPTIEKILETNLARRLATSNIR